MRHFSTICCTIGTNFLTFSIVQPCYQGSLYQYIIACLDALNERVIKVLDTYTFKSSEDYYQQTSD